MLVGEENEGWRLITTQLNHERVMLGPAGRLEGLRDLVARLGRRKRRTCVDRARTCATCSAQVTAAFRVNELLNWQVAAGRRATATTAVADASASQGVRLRRRSSTCGRR